MYLDRVTLWVLRHANKRRSGAKRTILLTAGLWLVLQVIGDANRECTVHLRSESSLVPKRFYPAFKSAKSLKDVLKR